MKRWVVVILLLTVHISEALANCDLTRFPWNCEIPAHILPARHHPALVYCGNTPLYLSKTQYDKLADYQRVNLNMVLMVNGEYIDSPCIPARR